MIKVELVNEMNDSKTITNGMLYEFLKEFKRDMQEFKKDVYRHFDQQDARLDRLERKVDEIYESRDRVSVNFTRT